MADERLQMFSANLRSGVNPVAQVPHRGLLHFLHRERPDVHRIRSVEFRGLTAARAGGMGCCSRAWREIEAAPGGPLAVADIDGRSFIAKL
jgi:hypothetical protein